MKTTSRLSQFCDRALEAGWLLGVTITPVFFNVYSSRVFEPDKLTSLRALAVVMAVFWLVRFAEEKLRQHDPLRFTWRTPLVLPALLTMVIYLVSSVFSLVPYTSILGSYQRLQGTHTLFGYLVLFFALITSLRTRAQLTRLVTVLILNSLPVSLYGIIQRNKLDPLPWAGDVTTRVASNMGNPIFVAAYLIMIVPLTASRIIQSFTDILSREEARISDILRASGYIFLIAVQVLTIFFAQSRGPWLGLTALGFVFPFVALLQLLKQARAEEPERKGRVSDILSGIVFGVGILVATGALAGLLWWLTRAIGLGNILVLQTNLATLISVSVPGLAFLGAWLYFVVERKGWRWLWIGWGVIGLTVALVLVLINVPGYLQSRVREVEQLKRLTTITELQTGSGKVRGLIWQGAVELVMPHEPIEFPDGHTDPFNAIRLLIGYGPESMYVAYNSFYPPELGHYESRTASPDRSHNETLDSLVITGILGLLVYLFTFGSFFYWGFRWLGLLKEPAQLWRFIGLQAGFAIIFFIIATVLEGAYLFAVAIPLGVLVGMMVYLTIEAFLTFLGRQKGEAAAFEAHPHAILIIGLISAVVAHFVEINFGIAIAATRTTFWAMAGILVAVGLQWVPAIEAVDEEEEEDNGRSRHRRTRRARSNTGAMIKPWIAAVIAVSLASAFLLGTLAFDFINNPNRQTDAGRIFIDSLTMRYRPEPTKSYGALMIFIFTWVLFGIVGLSELDREGMFEEERQQRWIIAIVAYAGISLVGLLIFGSVVASHQARVIQTPIDRSSIEALGAGLVAISDRLAALLARYYGLIFVVMGLMALTLVYEERRPRHFAEPLSSLGLLILLAFSLLVIREGSYDLIRADIIYKQGNVYANSREVAQKQFGIQHYEKALEYAPREDYYNLFLGKAYLELAQGLPQETSQTEREAIFTTTEQVLTHAREINPLNTDHSANLARFYKSWAARISMDLRAEGLTAEQQNRLVQEQEELLQKSLENYEIALTLSPHNPIIWNELAQLYAIDMRDPIKFQETISKSLEVDDEFEQTWMLLGDMRSSSGDLAGAVAAYSQSLQVRNDCNVRRVLGTLQGQQAGQALEAQDDEAALRYWEDAIATLEMVQDSCTRFRDRWDMFRVLAVAYANVGRNEEALSMAQQALELAPENQKPVVQDVINRLTVPAPQPEAQP